MMMKFQVRMVTNLEIRKYIVLGKEVIRAFIFFFFGVNNVPLLYMCSDITEIFLLSKILKNINMKTTIKYFDN